MYITYCCIAHRVLIQHRFSFYHLDEAQTSLLEGNRAEASSTSSYEGALLSLEDLYKMDE